MSPSVLIVERPGQFRDGLLREVSQRGAEAHVRDDAMEALASLERLAPQIVLVSDDPGPPGALGLCRLLQRKLGAAAVYRLGEPSFSDQLDERSLLLPRAVGVSAIATAILARKEDSTQLSPRAWDAPIGSLELGPLLLAIESRWLTGRLLLTRPGVEREIAFVRGQPVHARSTVLSERVGAVGVKRGLFDEAQLERAVELAHARNLLLGSALLEQGALDGPGLFRVLAAQLLQQLVAACNTGACHARFVLDHSVITRHPVMRLSPMTALLHAVAALPVEDVERVLDELAEAELTVELSRSVEQWLLDVQLKDAAKLGTQTSVRAVRGRLREAFPVDSAVHPVTADALTLTLLRSGTLRMHGQTTRPPSEPPTGIRTLSPPSVANAIERCAQSTFEDWPVSALVRARGTLEQAIDQGLHGDRSPEHARELALKGPEADCDPKYAEVYALHLGASVTQPLEGVRGTTVSELRMRCHDLLKRLDGLEVEHTGALPRLQLLQTRAQVERTLGMLPAPDQNGGSLRPTEVMSSGPPALPVARLVSDPPAPSTPEPEATKVTAAPLAAEPVPDPALLELVEPLVQHGNWHDLRWLLASRPGGARALPAAFALLYAIALKEDAASDPAEAGKPAAAAETTAIRAISHLLTIPEQSAMAVVIAKRMLRRRPLDWNQRPPARISALFVAGALLIGALVGFLVRQSLLGLFWK